MWNFEFYPPVIKHSNGKSPFSIGNTSSKGSFSIAMLDYQRVTHVSLLVYLHTCRLLVRIKYYLLEGRRLSARNLR